jgi:ferric-dicitrate binding protein FerR (iron transport regulator)
MSASDVRAAAAKWLIELECADSIEDIWPQFDIWLREDPRHRETYLRVERTWRALDSLRDSWQEERAAREKRSVASIRR